MATDLGEGKYKFKLIVDLEVDGIQDTLHEKRPTIKTCHAVALFYT